MNENICLFPYMQLYQVNSGRSDLTIVNVIPRCQKSHMIDIEKYPYIPVLKQQIPPSITKQIL